MSVVTYTNFGNEIVYENRAGLQHDYMRDSLGSTYALLDGTQTMTDTFTYWPYGEIRTQTGSTGTPFTFCGTLGYYLVSSSGMVYVRARYFVAALARWLTKDPLWPNQPAFSYVLAMPALHVDETGLKTYPVYGCYCGPQDIDGETLCGCKASKSVSCQTSGCYKDELDQCCCNHDHCFAAKGCTAYNQWWRLSCRECTTTLCGCMTLANCHWGFSCNFNRQALIEIYCLFLSGGL